MAPEIVTDLAVIGIILLSGLLALARGLIREVLSIASWVGAIFVTLYGFSPARPHMREIIAWPEGADFATAAGLFLGSLFVFSLGAHMVSKLVQRAGVGMLDRTLGFVFGLARGGLIVVVLFIGLSWYLGPNDQPKWFREARTLPLTAMAAIYLMGLVPEELRKSLPRIVVPAPAPVGEPPKGQTAPDPTGYQPSERRNMERLIDGAQEVK